MSKTTRSFASAIVVAVPAFMLAGCSSLLTPTSTVQPNGTTQTVYTVSAATSNQVAAIGSVAEAIPTPASPFVPIAETSALAVLGLFAAAKTYQQATGATMLRSIIAAVEGLPPTTTSAQVKQSIQVSAATHGVAPQLAATVASQTPQAKA